MRAQETVPDEDIGTYSTCNQDGENATRTSNDLPNPVNVGTIDDRSCYANYKESNVYGKTWGVYNITHNSNKFDATLQPRIERALSPSQETGVGSFARFTGIFRVLETGDTSGTSSDGSYIAQAKGKHTGGGGSPDPAICLYLAKPVYGTGANSGKQVSFNIYAERIKYRGGSGSGREVVFLKNVLKNVETSFELEIGFKQDPNDTSKKTHYCNAVIGGTAFNWDVPEPERGIESKIRYGAYRVKGGRAQIRWANTTYQKAEVVDNGDPILSDDVYRLRNVATGKFLTAVGSSANPVTMTDSGEAQNTHWTFVESGAYFNLDNETYGILRAPGSGGPGGPYVVLSTGIEGPDSASDKTWTIHHNATEDTYRFESRTAGRFLYLEANGDLTHNIVSETDARSKWEAIPTSQMLGLNDEILQSVVVKVYPNPGNNRFSITIENANIKNIKVFDVFGKVIYEKELNEQSVQIENDGRFVPGIYLVKGLTERNKKFFSKLVIN
ncbi:RICIN domain-containing protein [Bacteroidota bacterium]